MSNIYTGFLGGFDYEHKNPPAPFNPLYDPKSHKRYEMVTNSMTQDDYYSSHSREECKKEWRKRYDKLKSEGK